MRRLRILLWALISVLSVGPVDAVSPCDNWSDRFPKRLAQTTLPDTLSRFLEAHQGHGFEADFDEEKRIALLRHPLRTSGHLVFIPPYGLLRQVQKPFAQALLLTREALYQQQMEGETEILGLDNVPVARTFVEAFLAVFSGSLASLRSHFQVFFAPARQASKSSDTSPWQLGLKPSHPAIAKAITCLVLEGQREYIATLWIQETNGDLTIDHFRDPRLIPQSQWPTYRDRFNKVR